MTKRLRKVIKIDEERCTGCGDCIPNCPEGALQVIDGKARLVSDLFCDGLGACVGHCPTGAMRVEEREAEPYDETKVMANIVRCGTKTIAAHLAHLHEHGAVEYLNQALAYLKEHQIPIPAFTKRPECGCPSAKGVKIERSKAATPASLTRCEESALGNWPVQIAIVPISAPYLKHADILVAADCVGYAYASLHREFLPGRVLLIGCPKLDDAAFYQEKLTELFRLNRPRSITCLHMEVPCCFGLVQLVRQAVGDAELDLPIQDVTITIRGEVRAA